MIKKHKSRLLLLGLLLSYPSFFSHAADSADDEVQEMLANKLEKKPIKKNKKDRKAINFKYDNVDLVDIVNQLAGEKQVNVILPMGPQAITAKVTVDMRDKLTLDQAWSMLYTLLDVAGYSMIAKHDTYVIVKTDQNTARQALPIYLNTPLEQLPDNEKRIVYLYYFTNLQVPRLGAEAQSEIDAVLKAILPTITLMKYDPLSNGIVIVDQASNIKAAMTIIRELDKPGFKEVPEIIRLKYVQSDIVADLFNKSILAQSAAARFQPQAKKANEALYFPTNLRIIAEPRTNSLIVVGKQEAIERIKDFIFNYIDVKLDSGKSILHTYQLLYLDAETFAPVLKGIVESTPAPGGQSTAATTGPSGPERFFENVIITTDKPKSEGAGFYGGNKLIIAARQDDWLRIEKLIEQLDTPLPQVIIEVLIADLTLDDDRLLGTIMRNPMQIPTAVLGNSLQPFNFQSAQIGQVATQPNATTPSASTVAPDLQNFTGAGTAKINIPVNVTTPPLGKPGSLIIAINDPANPTSGPTWSLTQIFQGYANTKILSHPHVIGTHNKKVRVEIGQTRLIPGEAVGNAGGTTTARFKEDKANLIVEILPRISSAATVNLTVEININEFVSSTQTDGNKITRTVKTNATVHTGDILALGGLIKTNNAVSGGKTPLLGDIPLIGWLFKQREGHVTKNNLTVFIRPTIIEPRLRGGIGDYTKDYIAIVKDYSTEGSGRPFDSLHDPITRWFFKTGIDVNAEIDEFLKEHPDPSVLAEAEIPEEVAKLQESRKQKETKEQVTPGVKEQVAPISTAPTKSGPVEITEPPAAPVTKNTELTRADKAKQMMASEQQNPLLTHKKSVGQPILDA